MSAKNWWSATTGRVRKTLDQKRTKIREEVRDLEVKFTSPPFSQYDTYRETDGDV